MVFSVGLSVFFLPDLQLASADTAIQNCLGCINNTKTQVLTIFNFQTEDNPFLAGNATFVITPNPYSYTTNSTHYVDLTTWYNFIVSDDDSFDSDPTHGIIELVGVNNGTYSITQIKGTPGFGMSLYPEASDEILGTTGFAYVTQTFVNFTTTASSTIEPPPISDATLDKLKNTGGAKVNGITISNANDLPPAKIVANAHKFTEPPPNHVVFTQTFSSSVTSSTLFSTLGIPTYSLPTDTSSDSGAAFVPPLFVAPVSSGGGNFIMTPVMDTIVPGSNIVIRPENVDQGTDHPLLESIDLPMDAQGSDVGISVHVHDEIPSGAPAIPSGFVGLYLNFETTGDIDFSDPSVYSEDPSISFTLPKVGSSCPIGVTLYLEEGGHWHSVVSSVSPTSTDAHTCTYSVDVDHFSAYLVGTGSATLGHGHDDSHSSTHDSTHDSHDSSHSSHSHSESSHEMDEMPGDHPYEHAIMQIAKTLKIYEIQYNLETGFAQIIIGTAGTLDNIEVQAHGRNTGLVTAKPVNVNPFDVFNKQTLGDMNKYVFEIPLAQDETYFRISVDDAQYTLAQTVPIDGTRGKIVPWYAALYEEGSDIVNHSIHTEHQSGTGSIQPVEYEMKFDGRIKTVSYNDVQFPIKYEMTGAISGIQVDENSKSVTFLLDAVSGGEAAIQVPRNLVDATGDSFTVLVTASTQQQIDFEIISSTSEYYTLKTTLPEGASTLTIVGTQVVPEFGFLTSLVLSLAVIPIILARKRQ